MNPVAADVSPLHLQSGLTSAATVQGSDARLLHAQVYPADHPGRDAWILARREARPTHDPWRPQSFFNEEERSASGAVIRVATVFLTNRECPWRCVMCDLWKGTLTAPVPRGAIPAQIRHALERIEPACQLKLYNSGSFFDVGAVPTEDHPAIAEQARTFDRVVVESHPSLIGDACLRFRDLLTRQTGPETKPGPALEVAMGLETAHPQVLEKLNKRMTLDQFARAAGFLCRNQIAWRAFVLLQPPFMPESEALDWAVRSIAFAFDCGASVVSLIPTRAGNGALEALAANGEFVLPRLTTLEAALESGLRLQRGRVFADLWDLDKFSLCASCFPMRAARLRDMNLSQAVPRVVPCAQCGY